MKILDTTYRIYEVEKPNDYMKENDCIGYCDYEKHKIYHLKGSNSLIHELLHAYLDAYKRYDLATNEEIIETLEAIFKDMIKKLHYKKGA